MIPVTELIYGLDQKLNSLATQAHQDLGIAAKIVALNGAQLRLINRKLNPNPVGMDGNRKRYQDLQVLIEEPVKHKLLLAASDKNLNSYTAKLSGLSPKYMYVLGGYVLADKGVCKRRVIVLGSDPVSHADVPSLLGNFHYKPSFEYQETFYSLSDDNILIYSDGTFAPDELYVQYIRYPKYINIEGYYDQDDKPSITQDCELAEYLKDELLEIAVIELGYNVNNQEAVQGAVNKLQISE